MDKIIAQHVADVRNIIRRHHYRGLSCKRCVQRPREDKEIALFGEMLVEYENNYPGLIDDDSPTQCSAERSAHLWAEQHPMEAAKRNPKCLTRPELVERIKQKWLHEDEDWSKVTEATHEAIECYDDDDYVGRAMTGSSEVADMIVLLPDLVRFAKDAVKVSDIAKEFVDRMEGHTEELRWDNTTFRLLFKLITALRDEGLDAAPWWRH